MVVRASSAVKEIIFASAFGVSAETDSFVLAVTYSTFLPTVLGGAFATALIAHLANAEAHSYRGLAYLSLRMRTWNGPWLIAERLRRSDSRSSCRRPWTAS
jgi:peptidoglycan biosynthesis protein MviN/MurJ (putative lipid II flippase)